jgi:flagellar hook-basal body complex protein FliE
MIEMPIGRVAAVYAGQGLAAPTAPVQAPSIQQTAPVAETSFGEFLDRQITTATETLKESERVSLAAVSGHASAQDVVRSVLAAEMTVQAVVSVRDKIVQAYQDVMRMAI